MHLCSPPKLMFKTG